MDLMEWCRVGLLRIIIVKYGASAADRINGALSERERFGSAGLLTHDVGKEGGGGGGNGCHFWRICAERGVDRV